MPRYIDADALAVSFTNTRLDSPDGLVWKGETVSRVVMNAPTADVAPVVNGRWEQSDDCEVAICNVCKEAYDVGESTVLDKDEMFHLFCMLYLYCPHCGAKMDEEDKDAT